MDKPLFSRALDALLSRTDPRPVTPREPVSVDPAPDIKTAAARRHEWFAKFAADQVMPLLQEVVNSAKRHNVKAACELHDVDGHLSAELMLVRGELPHGARPPRLTIYAAEADPPVMVEFTGTFPHVGALGGFGGEVDYEPVYPSQIKERVLDFVALASGAGAPLR